jgi:ABC-type nitrate/sulfonate/bicarbonate transport system permease component
VPVIILLFSLPSRQEQAILIFAFAQFAPSAFNSFAGLKPLPRTHTTKISKKY